MRKWGAQWNEQAMNYLLELGPNISFEHILAKMCTGKCLVLGAGSETNLVRKFSSDVVGINISREELSGIEGSKDGLILGDAERLPLRDSLFDAVVSKSTLHHLVHLNIAMVGLRRVLCESGYVVLYEPGLLNPVAFFGRKIFPTDIHVTSERPFIPVALKKMIASFQFEIVEEEYHFLFVHIFPILAKWLPFFRNNSLLRVFCQLDASLCRTRLRNLCWVLVLVMTSARPKHTRYNAKMAKIPNRALETCQDL